MAPVLLPGKSHGWMSLVVAKSQTRLSNFTFAFHFHALEKEMATHSSVLAWRIPGMGEPDGLPSMGLHRVGHDWSDLAVHILSTLVAQMVKHLSAKQETQVRSLHREDPLEKRMATHSSIIAWRIPWTEEPWWARVHRVTKSQIWLKWLSTIFCWKFLHLYSLGTLACKYLFL